MPPSLRPPQGDFEDGSPNLRKPSLSGAMGAGRIRSSDFAYGKSGRKIEEEARQNSGNETE